jgi:carboxypeptidase PM20D1
MVTEEAAMSDATSGIDGNGVRSATTQAGAARPQRRGRLAAVAALVLLVSLAVLAFGSTPEAVAPVPAAPEVAVPSGAVERLAGAIRYATISPADPAAFDAAAFRGLHEYLEAQFPRVHAALRREVIAKHSLLFTWQGSDPSLKPILLVAHQDVVPVEASTAGEWDQDPFGGHIANGFVWGRGAIDNKSAVVGTLEAIELLLAEGFRPARTVLLAFGHDEEVGGTGGARAIAATLAKRGVKLELVLDEGGVIGEGIMPGVAAPVALIGVAEKGFVSVELSARAPGGHSSLPPRQGAIGIVAAAITRLEAHPMPARLEGASRQLFETIGPQFPLVQRMIFANLWATRALVTRKLQGTPTTNAMVRTTTATTIFQAGTKENVLPGTARAVANFRILPGDSIAGVLAHVRRVVDDERIEIRQVGAFSAEPSAPSPSDSDRFRALERTVRSVTPDAIVAPYLVVVITDARYYRALSDHVFRFLPLRLTSKDLDRMHGTNERLSIDEYHHAIRFYRQLILDTTAG